MSADRFVEASETAFQRVVSARIHYWTERGVVDPAALVRALLQGCCELCDGTHDHVPFEPVRLWVWGSLRQKPDGSFTRADGRACECCDGWHTRNGSVWP